MKARNNKNHAFGMRAKSEAWLRGVFRVKHLRGTTQESQGKSHNCLR